MKPTQSNILIERISQPLQTQSGILLKSSQEPDKAKVVSIGPDVTEVDTDDLIVLDWNHAVNLNPNLYIIDISNVIAIIE